MKIEGITGNVAEVTSESRLSVLSADENRIAQRSREKGDAYAWSNVSYDYVAANTIIGIENNSADKLLVIESVWLYGDTATQVKLHVHNGVTVAGTAITAESLNRSSNKTPPATAVANETGNSVAHIIANVYIPAAGESTYVDMKGAVVLGLDDFFGVDYVTEGAVANVTVHGYFIDAA